MTELAGVPEWTLADRLLKARKHAGLTNNDLAADLGYGRQTISAWVTGAEVPRRAIILAWALRCGVDVGWLETGEAPAGRPDGGPSGLDGSETASGQVIDGTGWFLRNAEPELAETG